MTYLDSCSVGTLTLEPPAQYAVRGKLHNYCGRKEKRLNISRRAKVNQIFSFLRAFKFGTFGYGVGSLIFDVELTN